jgi:hypothetical protein
MWKQELDTFKALGDPGYDKPVNYRLTDKRIQSTLSFMFECRVKGKFLLDVAGPSYVSQKIAEHYGSTLIYHTEGDLDTLDWKEVGQPVGHETVLMLEVLEHLLNPLLFLTELKRKVDFDDMIVSWPCRPSWLWTRIHFHEMRQDRFEYLCKRAGYEIINFKKERQHESWYGRFLGIRPVCRTFVNYQMFAHIRPI